jgi:O-antigen/teichoic acid export membrane protein
MRSRLLWRRFATAIGTYLSVIFGVIGTLVAARILGPRDFGIYSIVLVAMGFFQVLLDVTVEEALVKFGFRYTAGEDWGRLRRLFRGALRLKAIGAVLAAGGLAALSPLADGLFGADKLATPLLIAALIPLVQAPENLAGVALILRGRYDLRGGFLALSQGLRLIAVVIAAPHGVTALVAGIVIAQAIASVAISAAGLLAFRRFTAAAPVGLGADGREIVRFVVQSSVGTGIASLRGALGTLVLGIVTNPVQVGYFRAALAPQQGFQALSSPARLILLTEQTRDWERGERAAVFSSVRRYTFAAAALTAVITIPLVIFMPSLIRLLYGDKFSGAGDAARIIAVAGALQLVYGWTKSFPISIGRPGLRTLGYALEAVVLIPLVVVLARKWGATGGAGAILGATVASTILWTVLLVRLRREHRSASVAPPPVPREVHP